MEWLQAASRARSSPTSTPVARGLKIGRERFDLSSAHIHVLLYTFQHTHVLLYTQADTCKCPLAVRQSVQETQPDLIFTCNQQNILKTEVLVIKRNVSPGLVWKISHLVLYGRCLTWFVLFEKCRRAHRRSSDTITKITYNMEPNYIFFLFFIG